VVVKARHKIVGPVSDGKLVALVKSAKVIETDELSCDGGKEWTTAWSLSGLVFTPGTTQPAVDVPTAIVRSGVAEHVDF
jgi:hypothetical protein